MLLPLQSFTTLVQQMAASVQGAAGALVDLTVGSVLRALLEATASIALWSQWLILQVLTMTRAATSNGPDLDTWMTDFSLARLPAAPASGLVTFSRYTPGTAATVPVGAIVRTADGTQSFTVSAQTANPAWNGIGGYVLGALAASITVPVQAVVAGSAANVQSGAIATLATALPGVDTVTNSAPMTGGSDAENDAALRARFTAYINSRSLATTGAIGFAVVSIQPGIRYALTENQAADGTTMVGNLCVTVDDGSGFPSAGLLASAQLAVEAVRPIGSTYTVLGPVTSPAAVAMTLSLAAGANPTSIAAAVTASIRKWIAGLPIGGTLAISKLDALAHAADPGVLSVLNTTINGATADLSAPANGVILAATIVVT